MMYDQLVDWPVRATLGALTLAMMVGAGGTSAQAADAPGTAAKPGLVTRILAVGNLTSKATPAALPAVLAREVPATLELYLAGKIDGWYARPDQTGVVFILDVTTVEAAKALLDPLPLGQAGMMTFEFTPLGPLQPLGRLLPPTAK
ncbi:hypothetical protein [Bradyrhizobium sp.]|jgi:hypothetical protein|uniref:hypothetical protein n=1 Tax=Bradyrhizobium sp. TaxID=376 RepID=UPI002DDD1F7A|nr:hypothetical protein [Bradyrhizobium sp.]HEV2155785.1 hypothetical protein [Bradyrhizobium sp.]